MDEDPEQRRDLRLEATELFVKQQLLANLGPAAARRRGNLCRQQLANEKHTNDLTFRALSNLIGDERQEFIHNSESKLLEPPRATRITSSLSSRPAVKSLAGEG